MQGGGHADCRTGPHLRVLRRDPHELIEREKAGDRQIAIDEGKKVEMADKIAQGKVEKYFEKICLLD